MTKNRGNHILSSNRIGKLLFRLSVPAMIGMLVQALFNVVDMIFVGRGVGTLGIAGIAIVFPIQLFVMAVSHMIGIGGASIISRSLGSNNVARAEKTMGNMFFSALAIGTFITIICYLFTDRILIIFGATDKILPYARDYLKIILISNVFFPFAVSANNVIRAEGRAMFAMITMLISALLNIILDPIFIFVLGMGIKGAAIATVLAKAATTLYIIIYFSSEKSVIRFKPRNMIFHKKIIGEMFAIGTSSFVRQVAGSILLVIVNNILSFYGGDVSIAAIGIIMRLLMFFLMLMLGIAQGLQPIVGFNFGAGRFDKIKKAIIIAIIASALISTCGFLLLFFFSFRFISFFTKDIEVISEGIKALKIVILLFPLVGFQVIGASVFQAIGKAVHSLVLSITRRALFLIPLLFILPRFFDINGVWISFPISDGLSAFLTISLLFFQMREFNSIER